MKKKKEEGEEEEEEEGERAEQENKSETKEKHGTGQPQSRLEKALTISLASFFSSISLSKSRENMPEHVSKSVSVASWDHLPRHGGVWCGCWGRLGTCQELLGTNVEAQGCPTEALEGKAAPRQKTQA